MEQSSPRAPVGCSRQRAERRIRSDHVSVSHYGMRNLVGSCNNACCKRIVRTRKLPELVANSRPIGRLALASTSLLRRRARSTMSGGASTPTTGRCSPAYDCKACQLSSSSTRPAARSKIPASSASRKPTNSRRLWHRSIRRQRHPYCRLATSAASRLCQRSGRM